MSLIRFLEGLQMTERMWAMTTLKQELGYCHEVVDRQLAHGRKNKVDAAYDRAEFLADRTIMMQDWANYINYLKTTPQRVYS